MKIHYIIVLGCLIALLSSTSLEQDCVDIEEPLNYTACNGKLSQAEKDEGYKYCCYFEGEGGYSYCDRYTQEDYNQLKKYDKEVGTYKCHSSYLKKGLLYLVLFLLAL